MKRKYTIQELNIETDLTNIVELAMQLEHGKCKEDIIQSFQQMFKLDNYKCFGFYKEGKLLGLSSFWTLIKLYSGKQLELDNVIIDNTSQSKGYGKIFFDLIEDWAKKREYNTLELNTYITNPKSHKFYFNKGFEIKGYHFLKNIN